MATSHTIYYDSPVGTLRLKSNGQALTALDFVDEDASPSQQIDSDILLQAIEQLDAYFKGQRKSFDLSLAPEGTDFQQQVWTQLKQIPYGQTISYGQLAAKIGDPNKVRAVGTANGKNPIPIIIPCHRVIGADQTLVGYSGGIDRKKYLLKHEGALLL